MRSEWSYENSANGAFAALERLPVFRGSDRRDLRVESLSNSYTNSSFRVDFAGKSFLLRLPGVGTSGFVDRRSEAHNAKVAARCGVNAEVLFCDVSDGTMVCRFIEGEGMDAQKFASDPTAAARAAATLARIHRCGERFVSRFDPFERIEAYTRVLRRSRATLPEDLALVLEATSRIRRTMGARPPLAPCHNDPWPGNFVDSGERMYLIDWEYSGMNDPMWDLADLSCEADFDAPRDDDLLVAYFEGPAPRASRRRFEAYKPVCDLLWSLWGFFQTVNGNAKPAPGEDFIAYSTERYERCKARLSKDLAVRDLPKSPEFRRV
jgi:thiamine kinase-like enzyme